MRGPAFLLAGILLFSLLDANNKLLSDVYGVGQAATVRYAVLLAIFGAARLFDRDAFGPITTDRPGLHLVRTLS
ncbi:MAG: EamA/RhaT family transporter, partial [Acetobacteraceae bacterium]|nr:EamA/RhaT family transporter [Acetobacteraceae bacterium]